VKDILNPRTNYGQLLEQLATNSSCSNINNNTQQQSSGNAGAANINTEKGLTECDNLLNTLCSDNTEGASFWDLDSIRYKYLSTISSKTNERIDMKELLLSNENERKGKLTILDHCKVVSVEFENIECTSSLPSPSMHNNQNTKEIAKIKAVSVKYTSKDNESEVKFIQPMGGGEIILCAGVFESPRILLSSGLGPVGGGSGKGERTMAEGSTLTTSIPPVLPVTLLGIGKHLKDHTILPIMCVGKWWPGKVFEPTYSNLLTLLYVILMILTLRYLSKKGDLLSSLVGAAFIILGTVHFRKLNSKSTDNESSNKADPPYPLNCVHGYVILDGEGNILAKDSKEPPR
jgi:hypothetical protein